MSRPRWPEHPLAGLLAILVLSETLFLIGIGRADQLVFDEFHYVPAARATFGMTGMVNAEHPLLAKWLIGASMALCGDNPLGWRLFATIAGTMTIGAIWWIAWRLFASRSAASVAALATLLDQFVYMQARIAMLDAFMGAFLFLGGALLIEGYRAAHGRPFLIGCGLCLGLALGCKWAAAPYAMALAGAFLIVRVRDSRNSREPVHAFLFGFGQPHWRGVGTGSGVLMLSGVALVSYLITFTPAFFYAHQALRPDDLWAHQWRMYHLQTESLAPHPEASAWWTWPVMTMPIWYLFGSVHGVVRGILLIGNPVVLWGGLIALAASVRAGLRDHAPELLVAPALWVIGFGCWALIPKKIGFLYYYYVPAILLSLVLAGLMEHYRRRGRLLWLPGAFLGLAGSTFIYFLPIISAAALPNDQALRQWIWFDRWPGGT